MKNKIELFQLILKRTELCRVKFNTYAQFKYTAKQYMNKKLTIDRLNVKAINAKKAKNALKTFTKATIKRRKQLALELKTHQNKSANNTILGVWVADKYYTIKDIKQIVNEHIAEQVLLGDSNNE